MRPRLCLIISMNNYAMWQLASAIQLIMVKMVSLQKKLPGVIAGSDNISSSSACGSQLRSERLKFQLPAQPQQTQRLRFWKIFFLISQTTTSGALERRKINYKATKGPSALRIDGDGPSHDDSSAV